MMDFKYTLIISLLMLTVSQFATGSVILFDSTTPIIKASSTDMTLRCSLRDQLPTTSGSAVVGRSLVEASTQHAAERDIKQSTSNISFLTSIVVSLDGHDIATVTQHYPAKLFGNFSNLSNLKVSGQVPGSGDEKGYLELSWTYPTSQQAGNYQCDIAGLDDHGHNVDFTQTLAIDEEEITLNDLVNVVHSLQIKNYNQQKLIDDLKAQLNAEITSRKHVESGVIDCGHSASWTGIDGNDKFVSVSRTFNSTYDSAPTVQLSVIYLEDNQDDYTYFKTIVTGVDTQGFTMRCENWYSQTTTKMWVSWVSYPA